MLTSNATCPTGNPATSNTINMTINPIFLSASQSVPLLILSAQEQVLHLLLLRPMEVQVLRISGKSMDYWSGTNISTYTYTPNNNDAISCALTSNANCATGNPATSNTITMTVNPTFTCQRFNQAKQSCLCRYNCYIILQLPQTAEQHHPTNGKSMDYRGTNISTYTYTPKNTDAVTVHLTSNAICPTGNPATAIQYNDR